MAPKYEVVVTMLGCDHAGTSSLLHRAVTGKFLDGAKNKNPDRNATLNFESLSVSVDITDAPSFSDSSQHSAIRESLKNAMAVFLCKDVSTDEKAGSFADVDSMLAFARQPEAADPHVIFFLVLTQADRCPNLGLVTAKAQAWVQQHEHVNVVMHLVTSAKTGQGVAESCQNLAQMVVMRAQAGGM